ncbi:MAG: ferredoxin [Opitutae bacterium]|nr:ferredoxin [Opitutae bacterium]
MISPSKEDLVTITLNGVEVEVPNGINAVEAAALHGKEVPHYCYHPKLSVAGNCRMCLVEMGTPMRDRSTGEAILEDDGSPKIGWVPKPVIGCATNVSAGMHLRTESDLVTECREGIMEFLLVNHPLDCPICDQAGECRLQEFATDYGRGFSRYIERKNVKPKRTRLGPRVTLDDERCILCSRCIRFSQEVAKDDVLGFVDRGSFSTLTCFPGKELSNNYSLNTVDICPVGALTSTDFRFKMRVWFLKETKSICTESSTGCNTIISSREGVIQRITPRRNDLVNDTWMTDSGREIYKLVKAENRILRPSVDGKDLPLSEGISSAVRILKDRKVGVVASCKSTIEEQFLTKLVIDATNAQVYIRGHFGEDDGILLSADRTPNLRGALINGLTDSYPEDHLNGLNEALASGELESLFVIDEDLLASGVDQENLKDVDIVFLGTHSHATSNMARVVLPSFTVFEKEGSFINKSFIVQAFEQAIPGPVGLSSQVEILSQIINHLRVDSDPLDAKLDGVWKSMGEVLPDLMGDCDFRSLIKAPFQIDDSKWSHLDFVEKNALNFESVKGVQV